MNYKDDMQIDESALDWECLEQTTLAMKYARIYSEAKRDVEAAEEEVKVIRSELVAEANSDPVRCCGKEKPNAADIEAYYRNHKDHKEIKQELIDLNFELSMAEHAKNEVGFTRKAMLEGLIKLHGQQYFAGPKVPRNLSYEVQQKHDQKEADHIVSKGLKRNKPK